MNEIQGAIKEFLNYIVRPCDKRVFSSEAIALAIQALREKADRSSPRLVRLKRWIPKFMWVFTIATILIGVWFGRWEDNLRWLVTDLILVAVSVCVSDHLGRR